MKGMLKVRQSVIIPFDNNGMSSAYEQIDSAIVTISAEKREGLTKRSLASILLLLASDLDGKESA